MHIIVFGAISAAYCAGWLLHGLLRGRVLDNLLRMIGRDDERFKPMLVAYAIGLAVSIVAIVVGVSKI